MKTRPFIPSEPSLPQSLARLLKSDDHIHGPRHQLHPEPSGDDQFLNPVVMISPSNLEGQSQEHPHQVQCWASSLPMDWAPTMGDRGAGG